MKYKLFILFLMISYLCHGQGVKLELNLTPGKSYSQCIMSYSAVKQPQMDSNKSDSSQHQYSNCYFRIIFSVVSQSDSIYEMNARYDSLSYESSTQDSYHEITSGNEKKIDPPSSTLQKIDPRTSALQKMIKNIMDKDKNKYDDNTSILREMLEKTFTVKMSRTGRIIEVKDLDSLITGIVDENQNLNSNSKNVTKRNIITILGDSALKQWLIRCNPVFADSLVSKGEKWQGNSNYGSLSSVNVLTTYELMDFNDQECLISASSKIVTPNKDVQVEIDGNKMKWDLDGNINYFFKIDRSSGWVIKSKVEEEVRGKITPLNIFKGAPDLSIPVETTSKIAITN